jgi:hypothetical protein
MKNPARVRNFHGADFAACDRKYPNSFWRKAKGRCGRRINPQG